MRKIYIIFILLVSFLSYIIFSCKNQNYKNIKEGEALAKINCASIAYFPDYEKNPKESFIYWENSGDNNYNRFTFAAAASGRWMTMDAGDIDRDGDKDIILGSIVFSFGEVPQQLKNEWSKKPVSVVILKNTLVD